MLLKIFSLIFHLSLNFFLEWKLCFVGKYLKHFYENSYKKRMFTIKTNILLELLATQKSLLVFIYFWLRWVFVSAGGLSLVAVPGFLIATASHFRVWTRGRVGFSTGFVAPQHVESSWSRDRTPAPCIGRRFLTAGPPGNSNFHIFIFSIFT